MNTIGQREALSRTGTPTGPSAMVLSRPHGENCLASYAYDAQSRLISRSVGVSPTTATAYIHDGWNRIAEYTVTPGNPNATPPTEPAATLSKTYLWGLDISATFQGAGGVGGLLSVNTIGGSVHYPAFDGNGNITEYLTAAGAVAAHFEYDPFGNTVASTDATNQFEYRFSTKPIDPTTGLLYYGYRWYDPVTGRWPSRDPIEEQGGVNLYGFVGNDGVNLLDDTGRKKRKPIPNRTKEKRAQESQDLRNSLVPPRIEAHVSPKELMVKREDLGRATAFFGFVAAREALRMTLAPLQGLDPKDITGALNKQREHTGSICAKCIDCPNGEKRFHVMFVGPIPQQYNIASRLAQDRDGNRPAICPVGYTATAGYHSHSIGLGGTSYSPTAPDQPGSDTNDGAIGPLQGLADANPNDNFRSASQSPDRSGVPEFISGVAPSDRVSVWQRPGSVISTVPPQPANSPCPEK